MSFVGWLVEWSQSLSTQQGIVYEEDEKSRRCFHPKTLQTSEIKISVRLIKIRPAIEELTHFRIETGINSWKADGDIDSVHLMKDIVEKLRGKGYNHLKAIGLIDEKNKKLSVNTKFHKTQQPSGTNNTFTRMEKVNPDEHGVHHSGKKINARKNGSKQDKPEGSGEILASKGKGSYEDKDNGHADDS